MTEAALLAFDPVAEGFYLLVFELVYGQPWSISVDVLTPVGLQQVPFLVNLAYLLAPVQHRVFDFLVDFQDIFEVHCQIIFIREVGSGELKGGTDADGRYRQFLHNERADIGGPSNIDQYPLLLGDAGNYLEGLPRVHLIVEVTFRVIFL